MIICRTTFAFCPRVLCRRTSSSSRWRTFSSGGEEHGPPAEHPARPKASPWSSVAVDALSAAQAKQELAHLGPVLLYHDWVYYNTDGTSPDSIPDWQFDGLERRQLAIEARFPELARPDSRSARVGASSVGGKGSPAGDAGFFGIEGVVAGRRAPPGNPKPAAPHLSAMLSLDNAVGEAEIASYIIRVQRLLRSSIYSAETVSFVGEPKLDGLSLSLRYEDGALVQAATRGDGRRGDDVTAAARHIPCTELPLRLPREQQSGHETDGCAYPPGILEVRGEAYMPTAALGPLNRLREACGLAPFANARNAASAAIRQQPRANDGDEEVNEKKMNLSRLALASAQALRFQAYDVHVPAVPWAVPAEPVRANTWFESHSAARRALQKWGFCVPECVATVNLRLHVVDETQAAAAANTGLSDSQEVGRAAAVSSDNDRSAVSTDADAVARKMFECVQSMEMRRSTLGLDVDGVVFKVDAHAQRELLGSTARAPRWAVAAKFAARRAETTLMAIECSVGRSGTLTPVAVLAPVELGGATVRRASLHNEDLVRALDLRPGDSVVVERAGDVIPRVIGRSNSVTASGEDFSSLGVRASTRGAPWSMPLVCPACGSSVERHLLSLPTPNKIAAMEKEKLGSSQTADRIELDTSSVNDALSASGARAAAAFRCTGGLHCPAQTVEGLAHFVSRRALNIDGIGRAKLQELYDRRLVRNATDLLDLRERTRRPALNAGEGDEEGSLLKDIDGWGSTSARNVLEAIDRVRSTPLPLHRFIFSLGIEGVGFTTAELLATEFRSVEAFWGNVKRLAAEESGEQDEKGNLRRLEAIEQVDAATARFDDIPGIGDIVKKSICRFGSDARNIALVDRLIEQLVVVATDGPGQPPSGDDAAHSIGIGEGTSEEPFPLRGAHITFTGTLDACSREEAQRIARLAGAKATPASLTKRTTHLVVGGARKFDGGISGGSKKLRKAEDFGTAVLTEDEFWSLLGSLSFGDDRALEK